MANKKTLRNLPIANVWFVISKYSSATQFLYEKLHFKGCSRWRSLRRSLNVIENGTVRQAMYHFLLVICCNHVIISHLVTWLA